MDTKNVSFNARIPDFNTVDAREAAGQGTLRWKGGALESGGLLRHGGEVASFATPDDAMRAIAAIRKHASKGADAVYVARPSEDDGYVVERFAPRSRGLNPMNRDVDHDELQVSGFPAGTHIVDEAGKQVVWGPRGQDALAAGLGAIQAYSQGDLDAVGRAGNRNADQLILRPVEKAGNPGHHQIGKSRDVDDVLKPGSSTIGVNLRSGR